MWIDVTTQCKTMSFKWTSIPQMWQTKLFHQMCLTKVPTQQHSHRPQQRQKTSINQVTSEPTDPDSSSDDEYLQRICPEYR